MDSLDKLKYVKFPFSQFVKYYNESKEILNKNNISDDVKASFLQAIYEANVIIDNEIEEQKLNLIREELLSQIKQLVPEKNK